MNIFIQLASIFAFLILGCKKINSELPKSDLEKSNINGKVKSLKSITYSGIDKFGKFDRISIIKEEIRKFNESGNITETSLQNNTSNDENFVSKALYDKGTLIKEYLLFDNKGEMINRTLNFYDSRDMKIKKQFFHKDNFFNETTIYKYDEYRNLIEEIVKDLEETKIKKTFSYKYDTQNNLIEHTYNFDDSLVIFHKYDKQKNLILEEGIYKRTNYREFKYSYEFDENKRLKQKIIEEGDSGNNYYEETSYDKFGNVAIFKKFNLNKELMGYNEFEYQYDNYNNWVLRVQYNVENGGIRQIVRETERVFEYK